MTIFVTIFVPCDHSYTNKRHSHVIRSLDGLQCSPEFNARNFAEVKYLDAKGESRPAYEMARKYGKSRTQIYRIIAQQKELTRNRRQMELL